MTVSHRAWKALVDRWFRSRVVDLTSVPGTEWRHPWHTQCRWQADRRRWEAQTQPGWCRQAAGRADVTVQIDAADAPPETAARLQAQDAAWRPVAGARVEARLAESPWWPLGPTRAIGEGAAPYGPGGWETVLPEFLAVGVVPAVGSPQRDALLTAGTLPPAGRRRLLRACEVLLRVGRVSSDLAFVTGAGGEMDFEYHFRPALAGARLQAQPRWSPQPPLDDDPIARLTLGQTDPGADELAIATVYWLGPAGNTAPGGPSAAWVPAVRHHRFWDLRHESRLPEIRGRQAPLRLGSGLPFLESFADQILAVQNARNVEIDAWLFQSLSGGTFWCRGGAVPAESTVRLDPPWPYGGGLAPPVF